MTHKVVVRGFGEASIAETLADQLRPGAEAVGLVVAVETEDVGDLGLSVGEVGSVVQALGAVVVDREGLVSRQDVVDYLTSDDFDEMAYWEGRLGRLVDDLEWGTEDFVGDRLGARIGHEACDYTIKATGREILEHLRLVEASPDRWVEACGPREDRVVPS